MKGKNKCKILKEIRRRIAEENEIPLITSQCTYQGQCNGTCPKCEQELRFLEQELAKRRQMGKLVTVSALALGLMAGSTGCELKPETSTQAPLITEEQNAATEDFVGNGNTKPMEEETHELMVEPTVTESYELMGRVDYTEPTEDVDGEMSVLEGDIAYLEPDEWDDELVLGMLPAPSETDGE